MYVKLFHIKMTTLRIVVAEWGKLKHCLKGEDGSPWADGALQKHCLKGGDGSPWADGALFLARPSTVEESRKNKQKVF